MTGNKLIDNIVLLFSLLATGAAAAVFIYTNIVFERPSPMEEIERRKFELELSRKKVPQTYKIENMIINLKSRTKRLRFLNLTIHFVSFDDSKLDLIANNENKPVVQDMIIRIAGEMYPEDLNSISGKLILEDKIKSSINNYFSEPLIKEIFFTKFVVQ